MVYAILSVVNKSTKVKGVSVMTFVHCIGIIICLIFILIGGKGIVISAFVFIATLIVGALANVMDFSIEKLIDNKLNKKIQEQMEAQEYDDYGIIEYDSDEENYLL